MPYKTKKERKEYAKEYERKNRDKLSKKRKDWRHANLNKVKLWTVDRDNRYRQIMHNLKINGCAICGYDKCDNALSFHHTNPKDKSFPITASRMSLKSKRLTNEINKCTLLCCRCHREIEEQNRLYKIDDTINMYKPTKGEK